MTDLKSIVYIGGFELPDKNAAAQRVLGLGRLFELLGFELHFLGISKDINEIKTKVITNVDGQKYYSRPYPYPSNNIDWIRYLIKHDYVVDYIKGLSRKPDMIIAYNYPSVGLRRLFNYGKKNEIKVVADITEWYEPEGHLLFRLIKGLDSFYRMRIVQKKLDGIIAISSYLNNYYSKDCKTIQIPPLVDTENDKWSGNFVGAHENDKIQLVYVGSPGAGQKDRLDVLVKALLKVKSKVPPFVFKVIGISFTQFIDNFNIDPSLIQKSENLQFMGRLSHNEAINELKKSDFSVFIRDKNIVNTAGFPTKFVESISAGVPVLTNDSSNIIDYLEPHELGKKLITSSDSLLEESLIKALSQSRSEMNRLKENCKAFQGFDYRSFENQMNEFVKSL